ncbi:sensor domain-containing diguanylate cyclase [Thalassospira marina]|uniref:diguanylate cyclase n=1 Tax=Thalassospira marina TaxID=2048283 RepID=A0A2N3KRB2_9PROT|nr:sensor domain-containing diguanylate cyclase [Thalassospira marina]
MSGRVISYWGCLALCPCVGQKGPGPDIGCLMTGFVRTNVPGYIRRGGETLYKTVFLGVGPLLDGGECRGLLVREMNSSSGTHADKPSIASLVSAVCIVGAFVFVLSLFGILTRPENMLAALWPANAMLTALLVRNQRLHNPAGWLGAVIGFVAADLVTGSLLVVSVALTVANLSGVAVGVTLLRQLSGEDINLRRPLSIRNLCVISLLTAGISGAVGAVVSTLAFGNEPVTAFLFWFSAEFANYVVILPFTLTITCCREPLRQIAQFCREFSFGLEKLKPYAPVAALVFSLALVQVVGGPGAIVFPVPALLWCALVYPLQVTAFIVFLVSQALIFVLEFNLLDSLPANMDAYSGVVSTRLGIALLAIGPLTVASINVARSALMEQLAHAAQHDFLTGLLSRRAFVNLGNALVSQLAERHGSLTIIVIDIDHFKQINDTYGHAMGDHVLAKVAEIIRAHLRGNDLVGRLGGEEFALLLPDIKAEDANNIAQQIRQAVEKADVRQGRDENARIISITISAGMISREMASSSSLDQLILEADEMMYEAKRAGRNQVLVQ